MPAVPAMLVGLNKLLRSRPLKFRALRYCISGGAPLDQAVAEEFAAHTGATVVEGFGLSEASPVTHIGPLDGSALPGTIGLPLPDTDARIVDPATGRTDVPQGEVGELIIKGPQVMLGYLNDPEATARTTRDGWLFTGDLAVQDAEGFFRIVDRKKDLIITSGFNVYPSDVEQVLRTCPGVADVAVIGVPDLERGEIVKAVVVSEARLPLQSAGFRRLLRTTSGKAQAAPADRSCRLRLASQFSRQSLSDGKLREGHRTASRVPTVEHNTAGDAGHSVRPRTRRSTRKGAATVDRCL